MSGHCPACVCDALPPPEVGQAYLGGLIAAALVGADVVKKTLDGGKEVNNVQKYKAGSLMPAKAYQPNPAPVKGGDDSQEIPF